VNRVAALLLPVLGLVGLVWAGNGLLNNDDEIVLEAVFDDVKELVPRHLVMTADVPIGTVTDVQLTDDFRALVTMEVRPDTGLPADVAAVVKRTQVLGEHHVDLVPLSDEGELESGVLTETHTADELEELVALGTEVLTYLAADQISAAVHASATIYGGRGGTFRDFLTNLEVFVSRYRAGQDDVVRLIDGLDEVTAGLAPNTDDFEATLATLARNAEALNEEHERLLDALENVERLATVGGRIMREHREETEDFWRVFPEILRQITRFEGALGTFIQQWPHHNIHTPNAIHGDFVQLFADLIICETPTEDRDDPTRTCLPPNPGDPGQPHPQAPPLTDCDRYHLGPECEEPGGVPPRTTRDGEMWSGEEGGG
jgi:phospholipid/cholesterol/gamma-HCH transport system substrate-binding protein